jgi:hypothetical protein
LSKSNIIDDISPFTFDNASYRLKTTKPGFGLDPEEEKGLRRLGEACEISADAKKLPMRPLSVAAPAPTSAELTQWAAEERRLIAEAQKGDEYSFDAHGRKRVIPNKAARALVGRFLYTLQHEARKRWFKLNPTRHHKKKDLCPQNPGPARYDTEQCRSAEKLSTDDVYGGRLQWTDSHVFLAGTRDLMSPRKEQAIQYDDFLSTTLIVFWKTIVDFGRRNTGLKAYLTPRLRGALSDIAHDWRNSVGLAGLDSDLVRFIRTGKRWEWPEQAILQELPAWIRRKYRKKRLTVQEIEGVKQTLTSIWEADSYAEEAIDDGNYSSDEGRTDEPRQLEAGTNHDGESAAVSGWSRNAAGSVAATKRRLLAEARWLFDIEDRALHRLETMGRRAYALWLVNRETTCPFYLIRGGKLVDEGTKPWDKIADHYRARGLSIPEVQEKYAALPTHVRAQDFPRKLVRPNKWAADTVEVGKQWKNSAIKQRKMTDVRQHGMVGAGTRRIRGSSRLPTVRGAAKGQRAAASARTGAGG